MKPTTAPMAPMRRRSFHRLSLAAAASAALPAVQAQGKAPLPISTFFGFEAMRASALSPDGTAVAMLVGSSQHRTRLVVLDLASMAPHTAAAFTDADVTWFRWVGDKRLVFTSDDVRSAPGEQSYMRGGLYAVDSDGSQHRRLNLSHGYSFLLAGAGAMQGDEVWCGRRTGIEEKSFGWHELFKMNHRTGREREVEDVPLRSQAWLLDQTGELRAVLTQRGDRAALHARQPDGKGWRQLREFDAYEIGATLAPQYIAPDGRWFVGTASGGDKVAVHTFDAEKNEVSAKAVIQSPHYDLNPQFVSNDDKLLGMRLELDAEVTQWFDTALQAHQAHIDELLPATSNRVSPPRRGNSLWLLVQAWADVQPVQTYAYHTGTKKLTLLGGARPGVRASQMAAMDMHRYKARDGLEIPAYLSLPNGVTMESAKAAARKLPLIVHVHGGPWVRGGHWHWQADVQFLASRGYAVLQPEFRGSTGFGDKHMRAGFKQWGLAMQDDLADGARWAIAQGVADPKRIAIMGASYGGYATLMGLVKDPDIFRCGVGWVGVSDLDMLSDKNWSDIGELFLRHGLTRMLGDPVADKAQFEATSPLKQAHRIRNPVLLGHGERDRRVPLEHGERMVKALRGHNPNVEWVAYPDEGHGWSHPDTDIDWWGRVEKFLARHLA